MAPRRKKSNRRLPAEHIRTIDPVTFQKRRARSSLTFVPRLPGSLQLPMAMVQALFTSGFLRPDDPTSSQAPQEKFSDELSYGHVRALLKTFRFQVKQAKVRAGFAVLISFIMALKAIFGIRGAWVLWNAIFDATLSGVDVKFPDKKEGIAALTVTDPEQSLGWDQYYAEYDEASLQLLERRVSGAERDRLIMLSAVTGDRHTRKVLEGLARLTYRHIPRRAIPGGEPRPEPLTPAQVYVDSPLAQLILRQNPHYLSPRETPLPLGSPVSGWEGFGAVGKSSFRADSSATWADEWERLKSGSLGGLPAMPVDEWERHTKKIWPIQQYGSVRTSKATGAQHRHSGLDIGAPTGTKVRAMYDGIVHEAVGTWKEGGPSAGNVVRLRTSAGAGPGSMEHVYAHLDKLAPGLKVGSPVTQGQVIGEVGSTGDSSGPHLHVSTLWHTREETGDGGSFATSKTSLDPEQVIEDGAIDAARSAGAQLVGRVPVLAQGAFVLGSVGGTDYQTPVTGDVLSMFESMVRGTADAFKGAAQGLAQRFPDQARGIEDFSRGVNALGRQAFPAVKWMLDPGGIIRFGLSAAMGAAQIPTAQANAVIDALVLSMEAGMKGGDSVDAFLVKLRTDARISQLTPEQQVAVVQAARSGYSSLLGGQAPTPAPPSNQGGGTDSWWGDADPEPYNDDDFFGDGEDDLFDDPDETFDDPE